VYGLQSRKEVKALKRYETLFIVQSELTSDDITAIIDRYSKIITDMKGTILKVERWGKRKLAYLIRKQSRGFYILIDFAGKREIVAELERILKFDDKVLKFMSVKLADGITAEEIEKVLAGAQKAELPEAPPAVIKTANPPAATEAKTEETT
jgi:small subunit ribosomal protein S6